MQKPLAILLLTLFLYSSILPVNIQRAIRALPKLLLHYYDHRQEDEDISIVEFIKLHYGSEYETHKQDHDYSKLPGKEPNCCSIHSIILAAVNLAHLLDPLEPQYASIRFCVGEDVPPLAHVHNIWQPPESC